MWGRRVSAFTLVLAVGMWTGPDWVVAQQTGTIEGSVTAQGGEGLESVAVSVVGTALQASTNAGGVFRLRGVPAGQHTLRAGLIGRRTLEREVSVQSGGVTSVTIQLVDDPLQMAEVVVTATRDAAQRTDVAANIGVVGGGDIRAARPHHSAEIVNRVPGVLNISLGGEGSTVAMRLPINYSANYGYLEDGVPIRSTGFFNHNALYEVNIPGAERVEVFKGPATALYGSDAIGGVFNSITRAPASSPDFELFLEGGRFDYQRVLGSASNSWGAHGVRADVNVMSFGGWRDGTEQDRQTGTVRWDWGLSPTTRLKMIVTGTNIDSPGDGGSELPRSDFLDEPTNAYTPVAFRKVEALRVSTALQSVWDQSSLDLTAYARHNRLQLLPNWQLTYDPQVWDNRNKSVGVLAKFRRDLGPAEVIVGTDVDYSPGSEVRDEILPTTTPDNVFDSYTVGTRHYDYDVTFYGVSPYAQLEADLAEDLHLSAGLRFDQIGYRYDNGLGELQAPSEAHKRPVSQDVSFSHLTPSVGLTYGVTDDLNVFASYRHAFRAPSQGQLFVQNSAPNTVDLQPTKTDSFEAGVRGSVGSFLSYELSAYTMEVKDDVLSFFNTATFTSEVSNAGQTRHRGIEAGVTVVPLDRVRIEAAYALPRSEYVDWVTSTSSDFSGNEMIAAPKHIANTRLTVEPTIGSSVSFEWESVGEYWLDEDNVHTYEGYDVFNVYLTSPDIAGIQLVGRLNNVTDARYAVTASFNPFVPPALQERFRPGMPRTLYVGLQYRWRR